MGEPNELMDIDEETVPRPLIDVPSGWILTLAAAGALAMCACLNAVIQGISQPGEADTNDEATANVVGAIAIAGGAVGVFVLLFAFALLFSAVKR